MSPIPGPPPSPPARVSSGHGHGGGEVRGHVHGGSAIMLLSESWMRCNVTFRCSLPIDLDKHPPGEELAEWLATRMTAGGLPTRVVDNYEDFAWWIESASDKRMPWALLGYIGDGAAEWLIQINSSVGWFGRLIGRSDESGRRLFNERLQAVLKGDPAISDVRWHAGEWSDSGWTNTPDAAD